MDSDGDFLSPYFWGGYVRGRKTRHKGRRLTSCKGCRFFSVLVVPSADSQTSPGPRENPLLQQLLVQVHKPQVEVREVFTPWVVGSVVFHVVQMGHQTKKRRWTERTWKKPIIFRWSVNSTFGVFFYQGNQHENGKFQPFEDASPISKKMVSSIVILAFLGVMFKDFASSKADVIQVTSTLHHLFLHEFFEAMNSMLP